MATSTELIVHAYEWEIIDESVETDQTAIYAWCLNRQSQPCLLRFENFPIFCHIELPYFVDHNPYRWSSESGIYVFEWLKKVLDDNKPNQAMYKEAKKIYYYRGTRTYPMLLVIFPTIKAMQKCEEFLQKPREIPGIGTVFLKVWETQISPIRKLLTLKNCKYAQWFKIQGSSVPADEQVSTLDLEYIVNWRTLDPIPLDQSKSWTTHPGILAFDIECYSDNHRAMPNPYCSRHVVYMISCIYQKSGLPDTRKRYVIIMGQCRDIEGVEVIRVADEIELCREFAKLVRQLDPEILTGYNIFSFDYPYLDTRLKRKLQQWDPMGRILGKNPWLHSKNWQSSAYGHQDLNILQLEGRLSIDMLPIIRRDHKLPKYDLDTVGKHFLKRGKHDVKPTDMFQIYEHQNIDDMTRVTLYCIEDSELTLDLFERTNTWIGLVELSNVVGVTIMELFTRGQQVRCLSLIYDMASKANYVLDKRTTNIQTFTGGAVQDPVPGLYENVPCLDFKSLYPSIIQAFNICYTTLIPPEFDKQIPDDLCHVIEWDDVPDNEEPDEEDEDEEGNKVEKKAEKAETKHYRFKFLKKPTGILPQLAGDLVKERRAVVAAQKVEKDPVIQVVLDRRQWALKITANSIFGFLGASQKGRLPLPEAAMSITAKGRELITMCKNFIEQTYGARTIYGDSVTGDTPLLIRREGEVKWITIEQLGLPINTDAKVRFSLNDTEVWSDLGWTKINGVIQHKTPKQLYRVVTHTGTVDVTEDHSLLRPDGTEIRPTEIKVGDSLLHRDLPPLPNTYQLTEEEAWVWGLFFADGSCGTYIYEANNTKKYTWSISKGNHEVLNHAKECLAVCESNYQFNIYNCMESSGCDKLLPTGKSIKTLVDKYRQLFYDQNKYKKVPDQVLMASKEAKIAFLTGYYSGDGSIMKSEDSIPESEDSKKEPYCRFDNRGKIGTAALYHLACELGYKVSINTRDDKPVIFRCTLTDKPQRRDPNKIKKIIPLGPCNTYVYDLETENHHFAAGIGRLIVHNTDSIMFQAASEQTPAEALEWGKEVETQVNKLFGDSPLQVELEKVGMIFSIKKKKYAFWPLDPKTKDYKRTETGEPDIIARGIILARRENCLWQRQFYNKVLLNIMNRKPMIDTFDLILDECFRLLHGQVSWRELVMIQQLGANYKSNYFMKIFADELRRIGKPANPGDRLSYLIVNSHGVKGKQLLGYKLRLPETYLERLESDTPEMIDYMYYLEKKVMNCIEQLFRLAYKNQLNQLIITAQQRDFDLLFAFVHQSLPAFNAYLIELQRYYQQQNLEASTLDIQQQMLTHLTSKEIPPKYRNFFKKLKTRFITRKNQLPFRINNTPIKNLLKLIIHRNLILDNIKHPPNSSH